MASDTGLAIEGIVDGELASVRRKFDELYKRGKRRSDELLAKQKRGTGGGVRSAPVPLLTFTPEEQVAFDNLRTRVQRLNQVQTFFHDDPELMRMVDSAIANHTKAAQRRQSFLTVGVALVSLLAGWLLSAVSSVAAVGHLFAR
jgi:hypothetical protein